MKYAPVKWAMVASAVWLTACGEEADSKVQTPLPGVSTTAVTSVAASSVADTSGTLSASASPSEVNSATAASTAQPASSASTVLTAPLSSTAPAPAASVIPAPSASSTESDAGGTDDGGTLPHTFHIEFDYSLDESGWFDPPERRQALEDAARLWTARIQDDFTQIPVGTPILVRNLSQVDDTNHELVTETPIDDVRVYVACSEVLDEAGVNGRTRRIAVFPSDFGAEFQAELEDRWTGLDQEPWVVGVAFACNGNFFFDQTPETDDDIPEDMSDFITTAAHELGHGLGIGASQTFLGLLSEDELLFLGETAVNLLGTDVAMDPTGGHLSSDLRWEEEPILMDYSSTVGRRTYPTEIDFAVLHDIGYEVIGY